MEHDCPVSKLYFNISTSRPPSPKLVQTFSAVASSTLVSLRSGRIQPRPTDFPSAQPSGQSPWLGRTNPWSRDLRATSSRPLRSISSLLGLEWDFLGRPEMRTRLRRRRAREALNNIVLSTITFYHSRTFIYTLFFIFSGCIYKTSKNGNRRYLEGLLQCLLLRNCYECIV